MYGTNNIQVLCMNIRPAKNLLFYEICAENEQKKKIFLCLLHKNSKIAWENYIKNCLLWSIKVLRKFIVAR